MPVPPAPRGLHRYEGGEDVVVVEEEEGRKERVGHDGGVDGSFLRPLLRLEIRDLGHPGSSRFLEAVQASRLLEEAVGRVQRQLYGLPPPTTTPPPTRSVTVVLRDMGGVAYTTGLDLDPAHHKEIHFSLRYVAGIRPPGRAADEITGVLTHELVHCYQWDGHGTCPPGLVEGIADWVRLRCGLSPPHWRRRADGRWDAGYERTAYFLDYLDKRFGSGTVRRVNEKLRTHRYADDFWTGLLGQPVEQLWEDYAAELEKSITKDGGAAAEEASAEL